ncbi:hypothetical protein [Desulfoluna sp.]|uniref:hypothetical protein n=1 Tax=Desulfoluna sp. TaxID=2045199 RepID=UPI0026375852|nr:hypothetical protein [Desulfoluna sp.]
MKKFIMAAIFLCFASNAAAVDMASVQLHGFLSQGYLKTDTHDALFAETSSGGTFEFNEFGVNVASQVNDDLRVGMQLLSRDLGEIGNNEVELDWAYGDYNYRNWLGIRAGKMKTPYGLYNQSRDIDAVRTSIMLPSSIYSEGYRESLSTTIGLGAYGELPGGVEYQVVYGTTQLKEDEGVSKTLGLLTEFFGVTEFSNSSVDWAYSGDLKWSTPVDGLTLGASTMGYKAAISSEIPYDDFDFNLEVKSYVGSMEYVIGDLTLASEYQQMTIDYAIPTFGYGDETTTEEYYFLASYRVNEWFEMGTYYSVDYSDKDDKDGDSYKKHNHPAARSWLKDFALTTRFDVSDSMVVKLEGHLMDGLYNVDYDESDPDDTWYMLAAKVTFSF